MMDESDVVESRPADCHPLDGVALKKLCSLLRNNAHMVLNGHASFTLTTEVLNRLSGDFRRHSITLTENEQRPPSACEINSWRPLRRVLANLKKSDQKKEKEKEEWMSDIQFVKDFMLSTPTLKIIHRHRTLSFPISLKRFGNLRVLEIRKVPVHLIEGLQTIRGTLESMTIVRSVSNLKELLESCGGDRSAPLTWARLKFLSLVFNDIRNLDDSLRFVSHLDNLDLSHNQIVNNDKFLENLLEVSIVNLSYNKMETIPSFSLTTRSSLTSLFVRGNHLDNLRGLEFLSSLQVLDLGENYLVDHSALLPLKELHRLRKLLLDMNPLFYHKRHRRLTVCYLSPRAVGAQFVLDNRKLSGAEIGAYNPHVALRTSPRLLTVSGINERTTNMPPFCDNLQIQSSSSSGIVNRTDIIATSTPKKGGKRKRLKARNTEIRDLDTSGDFSSSLDATPGGSPTVRNLEKQMREKREEALKTQREIENLREVYGSNWLQAIQDRNIFQQPTKSTASNTATDTNKNGDGKQTKLKEGMASPSPDLNNGQKEEENEQNLEEDRIGENEMMKSESPKNPTEDDLYLRDTNVDPVNNPIMAAIAKLASGQSEDEEEKKSKLSSPIKDNNATHSIPFSNSGEFKSSQNQSADVIAAKRKLDFQSDEFNSGMPSKTNRLIGVDAEKTKSKMASESNVENKRVKGSGNESTALEDGNPVGCVVGSNFSNSESKSSANKSDGMSRSGQASGKPIFVDETQGQGVDKSTDRSTNEMDSSTDNSLQVLESECESEPIFVTLPESSDAMMIVTTTELYIVEKDVRGKVKEKLDIRCLVSMSAKKMTMKRQHSDSFTEGRGEKEMEEDKGNIPGIKMVLKFSYVRKDRRRRCYLLDAQDAENLQGYLQPFLDAKEAEEKRKKSVIMQCLKCNRSFQKKDIVHRNKALPMSGSTKDLKVLKELMETPTLICPQCGSTILIEVESPTSLATKIRSAGSTAGSTSQGSHSSNGSSNAEIWQQLQQLQQQPQQQALPRKPAPMLRNRSFDHFSPQASLAARVARTRNMSLTSADGVPITGKANRQPNCSTIQQHQSPTDGLCEGRGRSNAFTATGQAGKMRERPHSSTTDKDGILHVEDHFASAEESSLSSPNQKLAKMTNSLRGDDSSLSSRTGRTGKGEENDSETNKSEITGKGILQQQPVSQHAMSDSGFESGVYSSSLGRNAGEQVKALASKVEKSSNVQQAVGRHDGNTRNTGREENGSPVRQNEKECEKKLEKPREKSGSDSKVVVSAQNKHKSLAAMADLVNSLVLEGKDLEEKEMQKKAECESVHSFYSEDGKKSTISVSELKRFLPVVSSPVHRPSTASVDSDILPIRSSPSGNSIATLHNVTEKDDDDGVAIFRNGMRRKEFNDGGDDSGATSKTAEFVVGSFENSYEELSPYTMAMRNEAKEGGRIVEVSSPLSSSICNSMVSSVYETVVASEKVDNSAHSDNIFSGSQHAPLALTSSVDSVGSEIIKLKDNEEEESEDDVDEDVPSIYDRSKSLKTIRHKNKMGSSSKSENSGDRFSGVDKVPGKDVNEDFVDYERRQDREEGSRSSSYLDILDKISLGSQGAHAQDQMVPGQGCSIIHPRLGRQSSFSEQLYANPDLLERSYGSPTLGGIIKKPTASDFYGGDGYEYDDEDAVDNEGDEDEEETYVAGAETTAVAYRFNHLDHRLTLYLMMTLFENHEEFLCKISSECVGYLMEESYESLLIMSSCRFYILKVTDQDTKQEPEKWLSCMEVQPIPELRYIDVGLGGQSLRLEFVTDCSSYTLVTRNRNKTIQFLEVLHNHLAHYAVSQGITSNVVVNEDVDQSTLDNLNGDVLSKIVPGQSLLLYVMGFIERGHYKKFPVSFVVSPVEICLVRTNHQWPQPRLQAPITIETTGKQFTVLERQKINNIASLEVCEMTLKRIRLELFNETEGVSTIWNITMATKQSTYDLIHAISEPWAREFGVDMDISYSVLEFGKS